MSVLSTEENARIHFLTGTPDPSISIYKPFRFGVTDDLSSVKSPCSFPSKAQVLNLTIGCNINFQRDNDSTFFTFRVVMIENIPCGNFMEKFTEKMTKKIDLIWKNLKMNGFRISSKWGLVKQQL